VDSVRENGTYPEAEHAPKESEESTMCYQCY